MFAPEGRQWKLIALFGLTASLTNFLLGFSNSYPNTANDNFQSFINKSYLDRGHEPLTDWQFTWFWTCFLNVWALGYLAGTLITPLLCDNFGRKVTLICGNALNLLSAIIFTCAVYFEAPEMLFAGRLVCSIASSISFATLIIFLSEIAPTELRGLASSSSEIVYLMTSCIGMLMGMDVVLGRHLVVLLGFAIIPSSLSIITLLPMPESPKYLLMHADDRVAAEHSLQYYQGNRRDTDLVLNEMLKESLDARMSMKLWEALREVFRQDSSRRAVCVGIMAIQLSTPIWPLTYLTTELLEARFPADLAQASTLIFVAINFASSIVGTFFIEKIDRRPLFIRLGVANTLSLAAYVVSDQLAEYVNEHFRYGCVLSLIAYGLTYGFALGPIAFFVTSELVPQRQRSLVQSIVFAVNTIIAFIISFTLLPLYKLINIWAFVPLLIIPASLALTYLYFNMPETRGREIHEIVQALASKNRHSCGEAKKSEAGMVEIDLNDYENERSKKGEQKTGSF